MNPSPYFTLIHGGDLYTPEPRGVNALLVAGSIILRVGERDPDALRALETLSLHVIDASGHIVVPGLIDPHEHIIGAAGEQGFGSRTEPVRVEDLLLAGITTVVGVLGADTTTRHLTSILGRVRQLRHDGITAYMLTGGYPVPTPTITGSVQDDLTLIDEVIGVGEIAISDVRSVEPPPWQMAHVVGQAMVGGSLGGKAGVSHFHVGDGDKRMRCLRLLIDELDVQPRYLYPTHINRNDGLLNEAIDLARRGSYVDMDTVEDNLGDWVCRYRERGGPMDRLTASSDYGTPGAEPRKLYRNLVRTVRQSGMPLEEVLPLATANTAAALQLRGKGCIAEGADADLLVLEKDTLDIVHVIARGRHLVDEGRLVRLEKQ